MDSNYDEDLTENVFFQVLQTDHWELFLKATSQGCVICVPRAGSLPKYTLTVEDFYSHILIPSDELPESHFHTLNDKQVTINNRVISIEDENISHPVSVHILFEETHYTEDLSKYKVLCIENSLELHSDLLDSGTSSLVTLKTLRDCIDFIWIESGKKDVLEKLDEVLQTFLVHHSESELPTLQTLKDATSSLYTKCLQLLLKDSRIREKSMTNRYLLETFKISVEAYMHHIIYKKLIKGISSCVLYEDARLNKIIRNLSDLQARDLDISKHLIEIIPRAKLELSRIDGFSTILGKVGCLKKMLSAISKHPINGNIISADDLLPVIVFLVIKSNIPNWYTHLTFLKQFRFSTTSNYQDESSFLITSLEAAIEHIRSGSLLGSSAPEGQNSEDEDIFGTEMKILSNKKNKSNLFYFFQQVQLGNVSEVQQILEQSKSDSIIDFSALCHPLCSCNKCEALYTRKLWETNPTVFSCDDKGFTALHVAAVYGRPKVVDLLLTCGADPNISDCSGCVPMHYAASKGHQNVLLLLAHCNSDINMCDNDLNTPLHFCANNGHERCVKALIYFSEHVGIKLNINAQNINGDTPLHHASRWGYVNIVKLLVENAGDPFIPNKRKLTALNYAHSSQIMLLLSYAEEICRKSRQYLRIKDTPAEATESYDFDEENVKTVEHTSKSIHGIKPKTAESIRKVEKLLRAIAYGDVNLACFFLGITPSEIKEKVSNPILKITEASLCSKQTKCHPLCSCKLCKTEVNENDVHSDSKQQYLDINVCNSEGFTSLHIACMHGQTELCRLLIFNGALINVQTCTKLYTPLILACQNQRTQITKILLQSGCDIDLVDYKGNTALHYACFCNNSKLVEILLNYEPNLKIKNKNRKTPMEEAEEKMALSIVKLLSDVK